MAGWFDTTVRELYGMLYQYEAEYIFDSTKFTKAFRFSADLSRRRRPQNSPRLPTIEPPGEA
jgi:hypothetical protein